MNLIDTSFDKIFEFFNGKAIKSSEEGNYPIYGSNGIIGSTKKSLYSDAIILGRVGAYCGSVMRCKEAFWASDNTIVVKPRESIADINFCYYLLINLNLNNYAGGAAQPLITQTTLKQIDLRLPNIYTQRRIADILSAYDNLIENNQKQIKLLEEATMRLYKEWFVNLRFPGHENTPIVDGVPEGWNPTIVKEVSSFLRRGISPIYNDKGKSTVISQKCIRQFMVDLSNARLQDKDFHIEMKLSDGDVVICSTGTGTLGRVGQIFGDHGQCTFDSHVTLVRANKKIGKNYLGQALKMQQCYFESMGKGSTNQTELSKSVVENVPILIPHRDILTQFEDCIQAIRTKMTNCTWAINILRQARDKLLPKLMSGEIEV